MPRRKTDNVTLEDVKERLCRIHLDSMAKALTELEETGELEKLNCLDVINRISSEQEITSKNNATDRYKKQARFYIPTADLMDVLYRADRHINAALIDRLATNEYLQNSRNIIIKSESGCGKTFFACAFGNNACEQQYTVRYYGMTTLLEAFHTADERGKTVKFLNKLINTNLIIIDDFLLTSVTTREVEFIYRLFDGKPRRNKPHSFIVGSQMYKEEMYSRLSECSPALADAIMNRLASKAYELKIEGPSMREVDMVEELRKQREAMAQTH